MRRTLEKTHFGLILSTALLVLALLAGCSGGGGGGGGSSTSDGAPTNVTVIPGNGKVTVSWSQVSGASNYKVYYASAGGVTTASPSVSASTTSVDIPSLTNNTAYYFAVAAVGSSTLSSETCGVPSAGAAASIAAGFTVYDALCGSSFNLSNFTSPVFSRSISSGAAVLSAQGANLEPASVRGVRPQSTLLVKGISATNRVASFVADVKMPHASASFTAPGRISASLSLVYQPAASQLSFPHAQSKNVVVDVGLQDTGTGLILFRVVTMCTDPSCATVDQATDITYSSTGGFTGSGTLAASYDTTYTLGVSLDETTGIFTFSAAGGSLSGTVTATADASALLTAQGVSYSDQTTAFLRARVFDGTSTSTATPSGGGKITAQFSNVKVGFNTGAGAAAATAATSYDSFAGPDFDLTKWTAGETGATLSGGGLATHGVVTNAPSSSFVVNNDFILSTSGDDSTAPRAISADITITSETDPATASGSFLDATFQIPLYNQGGTTPFDASGDLYAQPQLTKTGAQVSLFQCNASSPTCGATTLTSSSIALPAGTVAFGIGTTHTMRAIWDADAALLTASVDDGAAVVIDPTTTNALISAGKAVDGPSNVPNARIRGQVRIGSSGDSGSLDVKFNNILVIAANSTVAAPLHDRWSRAADIQAARGYSQAEVANGVLYTLGGVLAGPDSTMTEAYNAVGNSWSYKTAATNGNQLEGASVETGGTIYLVAGTVNGGNDFSAEVQAYNAAEDSWTAPTSLPSTRALHSAPTDGSKIYVVGGFDGNDSTLSNRLDIWTIGGSWTSGSVDGYTPVVSQVAALVDGKIYVIGGENLSSTPQSLVQIYDIANDSWSTGSTEGFTPRFQASVAVVDGLIYVIGGATTGAVVTSIVEVYDPVNDTWSTKANMPTNRYAQGTAVLNGKIYVVGGTTTGATYIPTVEVYTP